MTNLLGEPPETLLPEDPGTALPAWVTFQPPVEIRQAVHVEAGQTRTLDLRLTSDAFAPSTPTPAR